MKVKQNDTQKFITIHDKDKGKVDCILLSILTGGDVLVLFVNLLIRDDDGHCMTCIFHEDDIVAIGPMLEIEIPRF